jgi:hypothetical protein
MAINDYLAEHPDEVEAKKHKEELKIKNSNFEAAFDKVKPTSLQSVMFGKTPPPSPMKVA